MPAPFPHQYEVDLEWQTARRGRLTAPSKPAILGGPPPEFDGSAETWSPEHLLLSALNLCQMTTFLALAAKARLGFQAYRSRAQGRLEKTDAGIVFTAITLRIEVKVAEADRARAEQLLHTAHKHCIVSNSLKPAVALEITVAHGNPD